MRAETIRALDYWLGIPGCGLLSAVRQFLPERPAKPQRILFLKFIEQGATVLAQDAIARATRALGRDNVYFCVFESNRAILDVLETVPPGNVICIRDRSLATFAADFIEALLSVRRRGIDTVIDMEFFSRASAIFAFLSGAAIRVGLHRFTGELPYRGDLMTHRMQYLPHLHIAQQYSLLVEAAFHDPHDQPLLKVPLRDLGAIAPAAAPQFMADGRDLQQMRERIGAAGASPIVILNPNASDLLPLRKWPVARFAELARRILDAYPHARIVLTGGPAETSAADGLIREVASPRIVSVAGHTSLRELLTLYSVADVLVTNDSGPGHFASLTPVHAIVLFGPETPRLFGPLAASSTVIWKELACSPCVNVFNHRESPCRNNVCMQMITVDDVDAAVEHALAQRVRQ